MGWRRRHGRVPPMGILGAGGSGFRAPASFGEDLLEVDSGKKGPRFFPRLNRRTQGKGGAKIAWWQRADERKRPGHSPPWHRGRITGYCLRKVSWLVDRPTGRAFPFEIFEQWRLYGFRPHSQWRARNGFAPFSLLSPEGLRRRGCQVMSSVFSWRRRGWL